MSLWSELFSDRFAAPPLGPCSNSLDIGRRYGLQEGLRHITPIPNALFVGMTRAHRIAAIVEDQTHEDGRGTARVTASPNRRDNATLAVQRLSHHFIEMPTTEGFRSGFTQVLDNEGPEFVTNRRIDSLLIVGPRSARRSSTSRELKVNRK